MDKSHIDTIKNKQLYNKSYKKLFASGVVSLMIGFVLSTNVEAAGYPNAEVVKAQQTANNISSSKLDEQNRSLSTIDQPNSNEVSDEEYFIAMYNSENHNDVTTNTPPVNSSANELKDITTGVEDGSAPMFETIEVNDGGGAMVELDEAGNPISTTIPVSENASNKIDAEVKTTSKVNQHTVSNAHVKSAEKTVSPSVKEQPLKSTSELSAINIEESDAVMIEQTVKQSDYVLNLVPLQKVSFVEKKMAAETLNSNHLNNDDQVSQFLYQAEHLISMLVKFHISLISVMTFTK